MSQYESVKGAHSKTISEESNEQNFLIDRPPEAVVLASKQTGQCGSGNRTAAIRRVVVKTFEKARAHTYIIAYRNYMRSHLRGSRVRKNVNSEIMVRSGGRQRERYLLYADVRAVQHAFSIPIIRSGG